MGKGSFIALVNVCTVASLAIFFALGRIGGQQLLIVTPVSLVIVNIAAVLGLRARKKPN
jgi:hypothetical protein